MAEQHEGFDSIAVIPESVPDVLRQTMVFGMPTEESHRPTFYFPKVVDWERHDREGSPWDYESAPDVESQKSAVQPICAYEFFSPLGRQGGFSTEVGDFNPTTLVLTVLEDEWTQIRGFSYVTVGPTVSRKWLFRYWRPVYAMASFPVFQVHCAAEGID